VHNAYDIRHKTVEPMNIRHTVAILIYHIDLHNNWSSELMFMSYALCKSLCSDP